MKSIYFGEEHQMLREQVRRFVNEVVPPAELMPTARRWAAEILECAPLSVRATKEAAMLGLDAPSLRAAAETRYEQQMKLVKSEDWVEGPLAFAQKRKPDWKGK